MELKNVFKHIYKKLLFSGLILTCSAINSLSFGPVLPSAKEAVKMGSDFVLGSGSLSPEDQDMVKELAIKLHINHEISVQYMSLLPQFWFGVKNEGLVAGKTIYVPKDFLDRLTHEEKEFYFAGLLLRMKHNAGILMGSLSGAVDSTGNFVSKKYLPRYEPVPPIEKIKSSKDEEDPVDPDTDENETLFDYKKQGYLIKKFLFDVILKHRSAVLPPTFWKIIASIISNKGGRNLRFNIWDRAEYYFTSKIILDVDKKVIIEAGCKPEAGISLLEKMIKLDLGYSSWKKHLFDSDRIILILGKEILLGSVVGSLLSKANNLVFGKAAKEQDLRDFSKIYWLSFMANTRTFRFYSKDRIKQLQDLKSQSLK